VREFVTNGHLVDVAMVLTLLELIGLIIYRRRTGRGIDGSKLVITLASGLFLMLGLRAALTGADWPWIALALSASWATHLLDLKSRWPRRRFS
jgi:hypothetical protein